MNSLKTTSRATAFALILGLLLPVTVFAYQASPVALTKQATFVTEKSARLNGQANPNEMPDAYSWYEWGVSGRPDQVYETPHQAISGLWNTLFDQSADIIGLAPSTQYFFRQVVENGRGRDVGVTVYFTTKPLALDKPPLLILETTAPETIGETTVTLRGYVSPHGDARTRAWFQWGVSQKLEAETVPTAVSGAAGPFLGNLTNLSPGTLYFYRIVGENSLGKVYGATRVFTTKGTPPPPPEAPIVQNVQTPDRGSDGVTRTVTSSGTITTTGSAVPAGTNVSGDTQYGLPGVSSAYRPGDVLGAFFRKRDSAKTATVPATGATQTTETANTVAPAAGTNPLSKFWNNVTGKRGAEVTVEKIGPNKAPAHTAVEYRITYTYSRESPGVGAQLKIILPAEVIYIGDNTNNELLLEEGQGPERTYVLPLGTIANGSTRTMSILGMTTGDANGFPDARARLEYGDALGIQVVSSVGTAAAKTASAANSGSGSGGVLPGSFLGWIFYILLVILLIVGIRKARTYYMERKEEIEAEEIEASRRAQRGGEAPQGLLEQA